MPKISGVCVGESLVGEGNEVAHVDLLLGPRGSAVETAYCIALTNNKDGFTTLLALVAPNLMCKPPTILYNKVTIKDARQAVQMFGPAQHAVAKAVADSVAEGVHRYREEGRRPPSVRGRLKGRTPRSGATRQRRRSGPDSVVGSKAGFLMDRAFALRVNRR